MNAIILLHEIYGRNDFMNMLCRKYRDLGFRVYCPDLNRGRVFDYRETDAAYAHFYANRDACRSVWALLDRLKPRYENVFLVGYSAGAALAWRCSENPNCSGVVACYGSRIRDYLSVMPKCPVLLIFAGRDCFDVDAAAKALESAPNTEVAVFPSEHGFLNPDSGRYDAALAGEAESRVRRFLKTAGAIEQEKNGGRTMTVKRSTGCGCCWTETSGTAPLPSTPMRIPPPSACGRRIWRNCCAAGAGWWSTSTYKKKRRCRGAFSKNVLIPEQ